MLLKVHAHEKFEIAENHALNYLCPIKTCQSHSDLIRVPTALQEYNSLTFPVMLTGTRSNEVVLCLDQFLPTHGSMASQ
jgi:hypothetical protein